MLGDIEVERLFLVETRICCLEMGRRSCEVQGQSDPLGTEKFRLALSVALRTTALTRRSV